MAEYLWRKMPRSIIRDEELYWVEDHLPRNIRYAALTFYTVAVLTADNDGIFDLDDGVVFANLMRVDSIDIVFEVANLFITRNLILRSNNESGKCILVNWEYKEGTSRTMEERRQKVDQKIRDENLVRNNQVAFSGPPQKKVENLFNVDFSKKTATSAKKICNLNDKNSETVVNNFFDDKNQKNVVNTERERERQKEREIEREIETERNKEKENLNLERDKETHTEKQESATAPGLYEESLRRCAEINIEQEETQEPERNLRTETESLNVARESPGTEETDPIGKREINDKSIQAYSMLKTFFAKYNLGFNYKDHQQALWDLSFRMEDLSSEQNPIDIVVVNVTEQYLKLCQTSEYYENQPILPEWLLKPGSYQHVLAAVSRILLGKNQNSNAWAEQARKVQEEYEADLAFVGNTYEQQYLEYGIDPSDPNRVSKLLQKQSQKHRSDDP